MRTRDLILAMAGKRVKAAKKRALAPLQRVIKKALEPDLDGVDFASGTAEEIARNANLSWQDFADARCSGCAGFTAADVRRIIHTRPSETEEP